MLALVVLMLQRAPDRRVRAVPSAGPPRGRVALSGIPLQTTGPQFKSHDLFVQVFRTELPAVHVQPKSLKLLS